jgi:hypothetical protein
MRRDDVRRVGVLIGLAVAACASPAAAQDVGGFFKNMFGPSAPPPGAALPPDEIPCPQVDVAEGGAAMSAYGGGRVGQQNALRNQITLSNFARECRPQPDGSVLVKVGVQGRVLLGPAGSPGAFSSPLHFTVKVGDRTIVTRVQQVSVKVPVGDTQGAFTVVQDGLVVPKADASEFEIEVGLGAGRGGKKAPPRRARGPAGQS